MHTLLSLLFLVSSRVVMAHGFLLHKACNEQTGWPSPLPVCSLLRPCGLLMHPSTVPTCETPSTTTKHPSFKDGAPETIADQDGIRRHYCVYRPKEASARSPRPLLIWFPGGAGNAQNLYQSTLLRQKAIDYRLSRDSRKGFILVSVQNRNLHWPTKENRDNSHIDFLYRDLGVPSKNRDIAFVDALIDRLVAEGIVDKKRIYLSGISSGGFFSQLYGLARHKTPTAGGNRVAAVAPYSSGDPFGKTDFEHSDSCRTTSIPSSAVPTFTISRSCDLMACDEEQLNRFRSEGRGFISPSYPVESWQQTLWDNGNPSEWRIINTAGKPVNGCEPSATCGYWEAVGNHIAWPDGIHDESGRDYEPEMLDYLRAHPLR